MKTHLAHKHSQQNDADIAAAHLPFNIRASNRYVLASLIGLLIIAAAASIGVIHYEFLLWDDNRIIHEIQSRGTSPGSILAWLTNTTPTRLFTPVSLLLFGGLADVFGIMPLPFHAAGVILHLINMALVYLLVLRLFKLLSAQGPESSAPFLEPFAAAAAAGLWGMNPLRAEVVAWVAAIPYALSTTLALLAVHAFISARKSTGFSAGLFASLVLYGLSVLSHPQSVALFIVFIVLDYLNIDQISAAKKARFPAIAFVKRHAVFISAGLLAILVGMAVRSSDPNRPFQLTMDSFNSVSVSLVKLIGFTGDFSLFHTWLPLHVANVYNGYESDGLLSLTLLASLLFLLAIAVAGIRRWRKGNKGLMLALICHISFCIPAAGLFMPRYHLSDRYTYGLAIVAAIVISFALRSCGQFAVRRLLPIVSINALSASLASITFAFLVIYSFGLVSTLSNWRNTHTLMVHLQNTAPSLNWYFFAKLRDADYWRSRGDAVQVNRTLLSFLDLKTGSKGELLMPAVEYLIVNGRCGDARYLARAADTRLEQPDASQLDSLLKNCP